MGKGKKEGGNGKKEGKEEEKGMVNWKSTVCDFLFYSQCPYMIIAWWHIWVAQG